MSNDSPSVLMGTPGGDPPYALTVVTLRLRATADEQITLPPAAGSSLRGAFGHALRLVGCALGRDGMCAESCMRNQQASEAGELTTCVYGYLFETPHPPGAPLQEKQQEVPRPFVLRPLPTMSGPHDAGAWIEYEITLIGYAINCAPAVLETCVMMGRMGLGAGRGAMSVREVWECAPFGLERRLLPWGQLVPTMSAGWDDAVARAALLPHDQVVVRFLTPTHLKRGETAVRRPEFSTLMRALLRRMTLLALYHGGAVDRARMAALAAQAERVRLVAWEGRTQTWQRYSSRQNAAMAFHGLVGVAVYSGDLTPFLPYLVFGQAIHVGKASTFGEGHYTLLHDPSASEPPSTAAATQARASEGTQGLEGAAVRGTGHDEAQGQATEAR